MVNENDDSIMEIDSQPSTSSVIKEVPKKYNKAQFAPWLA